MTTLDKELKHAAKAAYNKWFNRWYKHSNLPEKLKRNAQIGRKTLIVYDNTLKQSDDSQQNQYLHRRFEDDRFVKLLKQRLPDLTVTKKEWDKKGHVFMRHYCQVTISGW